jgi:hypothetical protein
LKITRFDPFFFTIEAHKILQFYRFLMLIPLLESRNFP